MIRLTDCMVPGVPSEVDTHLVRKKSIAVMETGDLKRATNIKCN
jgi:hypothetical protein